MPTLERIAPELPVASVSAAQAYYGDRLGFDTVMTMPDGDYAIVQRSVAIHLFRAGRPEAVGIHVFVRGIDALHDELKSRGATILQHVEQKPWGTRDFRVADLDGNVLKFTELAAE